MIRLEVEELDYFEILYALEVLAQDCRDNECYSEAEKYTAIRTDLIEQKFKKEILKLVHEKLDKAVARR